MYLEIDEGYFEHAKTLRLCAALKDHHAAIYPIRLWKWAIQNAPDGAINLDGHGIEKISGYDKADGRLASALCDSTIEPWLIFDGHRFQIVGWSDRDGAIIRRPKERSSLYDGALWAANRRLALARDGMCVECGRNDSLDVHHRIPAREFNGDEAAHHLSNLVVLCKPHHAEADARYRRSGEVYLKESI